MIISTPRCPLCGRKSQLDVNPAGYFAWQNGSLIQNALSELNADEREQLMTGTCPACWDKMAGDEDE